MTADIIVGGFFGDEGKGKIVAYLALSRKPFAVVRTGATNAGHTVVYRGRVWKLRAVPAGFIEETTRLYLARGMLVDKDVFLSEVETLGLRGRVWLDYNTGVITKSHVSLEQSNEYLMKTIGSTGTGVGAAMVERVLRQLKLARDYPELQEFTTDTQAALLEAVEAGKRVVIEASQGYWLSLYHGTYPFVTSRDTTASAALSEVGLGPRHAGRIIVVFKAYVTRVGQGPLPGEIGFEEAVKRGWAEYGTVTGRPRRVAQFNIDLAARAVRANSATEAAITKLDKLFQDATCVREWGKLPVEARKWVYWVEDSLGVPVSIIGTGDDVECTIDRSREVGLE